MQETIIETYLLAIDQGTFQKLMDRLLTYEGYTFLGAPGAVIGKNKTRKGTPDSFFADGERFIFCEYTTQERLEKNESFFRKLKKDIDHCFNSTETGINPDRISKIILGVTGSILPDELLELRNQVRKINHGTELTIYSIQQLPHRILFFPGLADKFIPGVKTIKGSVFPLKEFLLLSEKGIQPSLTNPFIGREEDIVKALSLLDSSDLLVIKGFQGVGKSKLAVHLAETYEKQGYHAIVVGNGPVPIWDDLNNFILPNERYIIVFDDANKALHNLEYLMEFLRQREDFVPKVIITVRDYVREALNHALSNCRFAELTVEKFDGKQIKDVVQQSVAPAWTILPQALERIETLSKGNCRIALMASSTIVKNPDANLNSAKALYDAYFSQLASEISILKSPRKLTAIGVLSFFGVMTKTDDKLKEILEREFKLDWNELWEIFLELEQAELIDMHSQEIAKISDQVLATYSFYKAFFDAATATVSYSYWVTVFIEQYNSRIRNTFIDLVNTYNYYDMQNRAVALLSDVQQAVQADANKLYLFFSLFWFYRDIDTLMFIQDWIELLDVEEFTPDNDVIITLPNDYQYATTFVELLTPFWHQQLSLSRQAIEMGIQILAKQPSRLADMMKAFHENLSYHRFDYSIDYSRQQTFLDVLDQNSINPTEQYVRDQIFLIMADHYLEWEHTQVEGNGGGSMSIFTFTVVANDALCLLRKRVLLKVFSLFKVYKNKALNILDRYAWAGREFNADVYKREQSLIGTFLLNELSTTNYRHCKLVKRYQQTLKANEIEVFYDFKPFLESRVMEIASLLTYDEDDFDFREREDHKKEQLRSYIATMSIDHLESIFQFIRNIDQNSDEEFALQLFMITLAEKNIELFSFAVDRIMKDDLKISNNEGWFVSVVVSKNLVDVNPFYQQINSKLYKQKQIWKQAFFYALTQEHVSEYFLDEFISFLKNLNSYYYAGDFDKYDKYTRAFLKKHPSKEHVNFVTFAGEILVEKSRETSIYFDRHICEKSSAFFVRNVDLLKKIYIHQAKAKALGHYDYSGTELKAVCSLDRNFLIEYIQVLASEAKPLQFSIDKLNLSFVWEYDDHGAIIDKALGIVIEVAPPWSSFKHTASAFFRLDAGAVIYKEKMVQYINHFISKYNQSKNHMVVIMNVISGTFADMKMDFFRQMAVANPDPDIYRSMSFEQGGLRGSTLVPSIERDISFRKAQIELLKALPNPLRYAKLIQYYEKVILSLEDRKERELKQDFMGWVER